MKKIFLVFLIIFSLSIYLLIGGFPIIIGNNGNTILNIETPNNQTCNPLSTIDFSTGDNKAILLIDKDDFSELPDGMPQRRVLICRENDVLQQMKKDFMFRISGGDMATIGSELIVIKNDTIVLRTNIEVSKNNIGIQNEQIGWAYSTNKLKLYDIFKEFKPYRNFVLDIENID